MAKSKPQDLSDNALKIFSWLQHLYPDARVFVIENGDRVGGRVITDKFRRIATQARERVVRQQLRELAASHRYLLDNLEVLSLETRSEARTTDQLLRYLHDSHRSRDDIRELLETLGKALAISGIPA